MRIQNLLLSVVAFAVTTTSPCTPKSTASGAKPSVAPVNGADTFFSDTPDVFLKLLEDEKGLSLATGERLTNDEIKQTLWCPIAPSRTQNYQVHIKNWTHNTTTFRVSLSPDKTAESWPSAGWKAQVRADNQTGDILKQLQSEKGWETPHLEPGKETVIKILLTAPELATAPASSFRITARQGDKSDSVVAQVPIQSIAKVQWSVNDVTWTDVTPETLIKVEQTDMIGLRAIKFYPKVDWPTSQPLGPTWTFHGDEFFGYSVWLHAAELTDGDTEDATAKLVNTIPIKVKVVPGDAFITYDTDPEDDQ